MSSGLDPSSLSALAARLLERPERVVYGDAATALVRESRILVTGAGGSIGSEIVRQLHHLGAKRVYLLDHDESALHAVQLDLLGHGLLDDDTTILADVRDASSLTRTFCSVKPDLVFHAAAHKHLPLLERYPAQGVFTNVFGTRNVAQASLECGATRLINVSTDKAARPTSILGATKRLAEKVVRDAARADRLHVASVRFGNVLGSRGSFLPSLMWQVAHGREVTVTHADVTRFFMTIPEASGLVIESATMADAGETYVLDMGDPVRIIDLISRYVEVAGVAEPNIVFTGLRPGEKLHEELYDAAEVRSATRHPRVSAVKQRIGEASIDSAALAHLEGLASAGFDEALRSFLFSLAETSVDLRTAQSARVLDLLMEPA